jgi:hypothetical protein
MATPGSSAGAGVICTPEAAGPGYAVTGANVVVLAGVQQPAVEAGAACTAVGARKLVVGAATATGAAVAHGAGQGVAHGEQTLRYVVCGT